MNFRIFLLPFSFVYAGIARLRNVFFNLGLFKQKRFDIPVILVGNLSVGGTGKTPHVEYLLQLLQKEYRVATLSRGYGRKSTGFIMAGKGISADVIGDEPMQYFTKFEDVTVAVCENRAEGIEKLIESEKKPQLIIMDDGYQHRQVNPGFKILLTSYDRLFTRDYVLPAGDLREPRSAYHRADCIIVTKCDENISETEKELITKEIRPLTHQPLFFSSLVYDEPAHFFSYQTLPVSELKSRQVLLFSGIADPSQLEKYLKERTSLLESIHFPDHHNYEKKDISTLKEKFNRFDGTSPVILTTEKDYQRLRNTEIIKELESLPCYFIPIKIHINNEEAFNHIIRNYVEENKGNS